MTRSAGTLYTAVVQEEENLQLTRQQLTTT